jgi:phosphonate transport system substrate-binding protein
MFIYLRHRIARNVFFSLSVLVLSASGIRAESAAPLSFGVVPQFEPRKLAGIWKPVLNQLEARTGLTFKMTGSATIPAFERAFLLGQFDFAYMNPYHAMLAARDGAYQPLIRDGGRKLFGILVVRKDDPIKDVASLKGEQLAFPGPNAIGASLLIRADLDRLHGIKVVPKYVQTHSSVYLHVALGLTRGGAGVMSTLRRQAAEIQDRLRVLYRTREMPTHPVVVHRRVPEAHRNQVRDAFLALSKSKAGRQLLDLIPMKKVVAASADDYKILANWGLEQFYEKTP